MNRVHLRDVSFPARTPARPPHPAGAGARTARSATRRSGSFAAGERVAGPARQGVRGGQIRHLLGASAGAWAGSTSASNPTVPRSDPLPETVADVLRRGAPSAGATTRPQTARLCRRRKSRSPELSSMQARKRSRRERNRRRPRRVDVSPQGSRRAPGPYLRVLRAGPPTRRVDMHGVRVRALDWLIRLDSLPRGGTMKAPYARSSRRGGHADVRCVGKSLRSEAASGDNRAKGLRTHRRSASSFSPRYRPDLKADSGTETCSVSASAS